MDELLIVLVFWLVVVIVSRPISFGSKKSQVQFRLEEDTDMSDTQTVTPENVTDNEQ